MASQQRPEHNTREKRNRKANVGMRLLCGVFSAPTKIVNTALVILAERLWKYLKLAVLATLQNKFLRSRGNYK